jgi:predicted enzyme related to lactoylglutathione lyase
MFLGLRTITHPAPDLDAAKAWFTELLGHGPSFDEPFYVGFDVGGYELGLVPDAPVEEGSTTYWGVADADAASRRLQELGAEVRAEVHEVGEGIRLGTFTTPAGQVVGIIENPHFALPDGPASPGPGR